MGYGIVVVGTSWGGLQALRALIGGLPGDFGMPVVVVQHRHRQSDHMLSTLLQDMTDLNVCEVEDKAPVTAGNVYIAPADYHLLVDDGQFSLTLDAPVRYSRPSIDVTFESVADSYGGRAVGVVLTGANADGSRGLARIRDRGGLTVVQDPEQAESATMPRAALKSVPDAKVLAVRDIPPYLAALPVDAKAPAHARPRQSLDGSARKHLDGGSAARPDA